MIIPVKITVAAIFPESDIAIWIVNRTPGNLRHIQKVVARFVIFCHAVDCYQIAGLDRFVRLHVVHLQRLTNIRNDGISLFGMSHNILLERICVPLGHIFSPRAYI